MQVIFPCQIFLQFVKIPMGKRICYNNKEFIISSSDQYRFVKYFTFKSHIQAKNYYLYEKNLG